MAHRPLLNNFYTEVNSSNSEEAQETMPEKKLAESWSSLDVFNHKHQGRISKRNSDPQDSPASKPAEPILDFPSLRTPLPKINEDFIIPELPSGKHLVLDILSTWGDRHYVGLNGIEIFSVTGELAQVSQVSLYQCLSCCFCGGPLPWILGSL